eukprot:jgi/Botrbrau1/11071/Bobra.0302s0013.1
MKPLELSNLIWGMSLAGQWDKPVWEKAVQDLSQRSRARSLEPRLMRQLFQAVARARAEGASLDLPPDIQQSADKWWRASGGPGSRKISGSHARVVRLVEGLGLEDHSVQLASGIGLPSLDVALRDASGRKFAIQVVGPHETAQDGSLLGRAKSDKRLLEKLGWTVAYLSSESDAAVSERTLHEFLAANLPDLRVPRTRVPGAIDKSSGNRYPRRGGAQAGPRGTKGRAPSGTGPTDRWQNHSRSSGKSKKGGEDLEW